MNALIFGAPGSGKGTCASRLQSKLGAQVICMGDILRAIIKDNSPLGKKVKNYVEKGLLAPDEIVIEVLQKTINDAPKSSGFILDGFPRTVAQAEALGKIAKIDAIMMLCSCSNHYRTLIHKTNLQELRRSLQYKVLKTKSRKRMRQMRWLTVSTCR